MGLQPALRTKSGGLYPLTESAALPGKMGRDFMDPEIRTARVVHRTPYGPPWVEEGGIVSCTGSFSIRIGAYNAEEAGRIADRWTRVLENLDRVYLGARYLQVIRVLDRPTTPYGGEPHRIIPVSLEYADNLWRLSPDDQRPTRFPIEAELGDYPFGMLKTTAQGDTYLEAEPLGSVGASLATITLPNTGLTLRAVELTYDSEF